MLEEWPCGYQAVTDDIVELLKNSEWLEKFFCDLLDKVTTVLLEYFLKCITDQSIRL